MGSYSQQKCLNSHLAAAIVVGSTYINFLINARVVCQSFDVT